MDGSAGALPEHSPLGASSAERWIHCPGSVALIKALGPDDDGGEFAEAGTAAHALAAHCLNHDLDAWEAMADFPLAEPDPVQAYLDYCRKTRGMKYVELQLAHTTFHPQMFGTLDFAAIDVLSKDADTEFVDYKNGVGVIVDVERNPQLMYYAFAFIDGESWPDDLPRLPDEHPIRLTIFQPRVTWLDPCRSWDTTAGEIRRWAHSELHAAMERAGEHTFKMGEHCRFCPAKLVCPAMRHLGADAALAAAELNAGLDLASTDGEWLGQWYSRLPQLRMFIKAIDGETDRRMQNGQAVPGTKLVFGRIDRVWKAEAPNKLLELYGDGAWRPLAIKSPAEAEKLPGGKEFVAEYAMKPSAPLTVALESDKRPAQRFISDEEMFAGVEVPA